MNIENELVVDWNTAYDQKNIWDSYHVWEEIVEQELEDRKITTIRKNQYFIYRKWKIKYYMKINVILLSTVMSFFWERGNGHRYEKRMDRSNILKWKMGF